MSATTRLAELLARDLSVLDAAVLIIDGIIFPMCCCVVALVVTTDGTKIPVGVWEGDTENATVVRDLLADLVARNLSYEEGILSCSTARRRSPRGSGACSETCRGPEMHLAQEKELGDYLEKTSPGDRPQARPRSTTRTAPRAEGSQRPRRPAQGQHPCAAATLREGLDEMFTVRRLGVPDRLARSMICTNIVESMISVVRLSRAGEALARRHDGAPLGRHRHARGRALLPPGEGLQGDGTLVKAVRSEVARRLAEEEGGVVTPAKYDQAAA